MKNQPHEGWIAPSSLGPSHNLPAQGRASDCRVNEYMHIADGAMFALTVNPLVLTTEQLQLKGRTTHTLGNVSYLAKRAGERDGKEGMALWQPALSCSMR